MRTQTRAGFTLVELMVAMALTLFIMVILSQAFVLSLETFASMKGLGDMQINLRTATNILRDDLSQDHFEGKRRLSDLDAAKNPLIVQQVPQAGFFAVLHGSPVGSTWSSVPPTPAIATVGLNAEVPVAPLTFSPYVNEGSDTNGLPSYRAVNHAIYMTVKRRGNRQENFFTVALPGPVAQLNTFFQNATAYDVAPNALADQTMTLPWPPPPAVGAPPAFYSSQWAEVLYYLVRVGSTEEPNNPASTLGTPTYGLYRAQFVMVPDSTNVNKAITLTAPTVQSTFANLSCNLGASPGFYSPADAAQGKRVFIKPTNFNPAIFSTSARGGLVSTLVLPNVISFDVQVMRTTDTSFSPTNLTGATFALYDTTKFNTVGYTNNVGLQAIQITLRVWDNKTRQTRQVTVVQDL